MEARIGVELIAWCVFLVWGIVAAVLARRFVLSFVQFIKKANLWLSKHLAHDDREEFPFFVWYREWTTPSVWFWRIIGTSVAAWSLYNLLDILM